jgi:hypothetical protein
MRKSHAIASAQPPPTQEPLIARDGRLAEPAQRLVAAVDRLLVRLAGRRVAAHGRELADVGPGAEVAAGAGQDHEPHVLCFGQPAADQLQLAPHREAHGIAPRGPVQDDHGDRVLPGPNEEVRHAASPPLAACTHAGRSVG